MSFLFSNKEDEEKIRQAANGGAVGVPNSQSTTSLGQSSSYETASEHESMVENLTPAQLTNNTTSRTVVDEDVNSTTTITEANAPQKLASTPGKDVGSGVSTKDGANHNGESDSSDEHAEVPFTPNRVNDNGDNDDDNDDDESFDDENPRLDDIDSGFHRSLSRISRTRTLERKRSLTLEGKDVSEDEGIPLDKLKWDSPTDPDNPQNWPSWKKWFITMTTACVALVVTFGSSLYTCGIQDIVLKGMASQELAISGLTFYVLGLSFGPVIAAPLSELFGRRVVYLTSFPISLIFTLGVGFSKRIREILVLRFFAGLIGSPALAVCSGTISDLWSLDKIEVAMSFFCIAPFAGPVVGPVIGGYAAEAKGWKWTMWIDLFAGALILPFLIICPETYKPTLLYRRAKKRGINVQKPDVSAWAFFKQIIQLFITKPIVMLVSEPIVLVFSIWSAFIFAVLFGFFEAYPVIFRGVYMFNLGNSGLPFLGIGLGLVLGMLLYLWLVAHVFWKTKDGSNPLYKNGVFTPPVPESRLLPAKIGAIFLPIGLFWVGWAGRKNVHWIVSIIGGVPFGFGLILIFFSTITYFSLSYPPISVASAIAANNLMRYVIASVFPLFTVQMYENVGIGWASSIFAFISLAMVPIPWIFEKYGPRLRETSRFSYGALIKKQKAEEEKQKQQDAELKRNSEPINEKSTTQEPVSEKDVGGETAFQSV